MYTSKLKSKTIAQGHIRVLIVDDHILVIAGLKSLLTNNGKIKVVKSVVNGAETFAFLEKQQVDIVLLDINLPDTNGIDVCQKILKKYPHIRVIGLSTYNDRSIVNQMISNGARGYLLKNVNAEELTKAIVTVHQDGYYYGVEIQKLMADTIFGSQDEFPRLTKREKQILMLIAEGKTTNHIAKELFISPLTVETHRRNMMKKLKVTNVASLIKIASEKMLI